MKYTRVKEVTVQEEETLDILCNQCGESCKDRCNMNYEGLIEIEICGGYASRLGDFEHYRFSLCEKCLEAMFKTFRIPAQKWNPMFDGTEDLMVEGPPEQQDLKFAGG